MSLATPLAKVRGLGSAKEGVQHWWYQRLTAIALAPLSLWFIYALATIPSFDYASIRAWLTTPMSAVLLILFIPCLFHHAQLGMQVVVEDYIESEWQKLAAIILIKFLATLAAVISLLALVTIYIGI